MQEVTGSTPVFSTLAVLFSGQPFLCLKGGAMQDRNRHNWRRIERKIIMSADKEWLYGKTSGELRQVAAETGMKPYAAAQIASWLYKRNIASVGEMTDISIRDREALSEKYTVGAIPPAKADVSADGTKKYLFPTLNGGLIESAYIPDADRATLCVSSQAGCRMGCRFCMTARQGFQHDLSSGEILNQIKSIPEREKLTNIVYMGMGEPLDNLGEVLKSIEILTSDWGYGRSPGRVTLSTIGVIPAMREFLLHSKAHLAVSLHNPFHEERLAMMPAENKYPVKDVVAEIRRHDFTHQRRVSFEYILFRGINDSSRHVAELGRLLAGLKCRINLIRFHETDDTPYKSADGKIMAAFRDALTAKGFTTTIRASRGEDIRAACGLLSTREMLRERE